MMLKTMKMTKSLTLDVRIFKGTRDQNHDDLGILYLSLKHIQQTFKGNFLALNIIYCVGLNENRIFVDILRLILNPSPQIWRF